MVNIGILTHGGNTPGVNTAIYSIVKKVQEADAGKVIGIMHGYKGVLNMESRILSPREVREWHDQPGTNLGTSRINPFNYEGHDCSGDILHNLERMGVDCLIVLGGNGTLSLTYALHEKGLNVIGIPRTIDNDVMGTDTALGFNSAVEQTSSLIRNLKSDAASNNSIHLAEVMGRDVGRLALQSGKVAGAVMILIPEYKFTLEQVVDRLKERKSKGADSNVIVYAEKAMPRDEGELSIDKMTVPPGSEGDIGLGFYLAMRIRELTLEQVRYERFGRAQRSPLHTSTTDLLLGSYFGAAAVELALQEKNGLMVSLRNGVITEVDLREVTTGLNKVNVEKEYDTLRLTAARSGLGARLY